MQHCFKRDCKKGVQETPLAKESAYPDSWNKVFAFLMKHPFHPEILSEITHQLWDTVQSFGEDCQEIWNKQGAMTQGEQALAHASMLKPLQNNIFDGKDKLD